MNDDYDAALLDPGDAVENQQQQLSPATAKHPRSANTSPRGSSAPNARWVDSNYINGASPDRNCRPGTPGGERNEEAALA